MSQNTQRARVGEVREKMHALEGPTARSAQRADEIVARFELFLERAYDIEHVCDVAAEHVTKFVLAKGSTGETATATKHVKRTVLRLFFRTARQHFGFEGDPTVDLALPPRTMLTARPLTEEEVLLGRSFSLRTTKETRQPAAWALCEATAITAELGYITLDDLDLDCSEGPRVWLHGSRNREPRWGLLDD
jgi:integrase/recombinase XerC